MAHMNDERGCSKCRSGEERYEQLTTSVTAAYYHYEYRTPSGRLFSTIAPTLDEARARCDSWLAETGYLDK